MQIGVAPPQSPSALQPPAVSDVVEVPAVVVDALPAVEVVFVVSDPDVESVVVPVSLAVPDGGNACVECGHPAAAVRAPAATANRHHLVQDQVIQTPLPRNAYFERLPDLVTRRAPVAGTAVARW